MCLSVIYLYIKTGFRDFILFFHDGFGFGFFHDSFWFRFFLRTVSAWFGLSYFGLSRFQGLLAWSLPGELVRATQNRNRNLASKKCDHHRSKWFRMHVFSLIILTSVWNLLSQRYKDVLIGLNGSKSILTFFSLPSSVTIVPQYITNPFGGTVEEKCQRICVIVETGMMDILVN